MRVRMGIDPSRLRYGVPALVLDGLCAAGAVVVSYALRFGAGDARHFLSAAGETLTIVVLLQLGLATVSGLYQPAGQLMWPLRLSIAAAGGAIVGLIVALAPDLRAGVSRQALGSQIALFAIGGALWRSVAELRIRQRLR